MIRRLRNWLGFLLALGLAALAAVPAFVNAAGLQGQSDIQPANQKTQTVEGEAEPTQGSNQVTESLQTDRDYSFSEVISESVFGNVYAEPSNWQELGYSNLFSKGWDKPWASPPAGGGGAPRQGWINAEDGVFYRLSIATFSWQHGLANNSDGYNGVLTSYTPLNQRFEIRTDIGLVSNRGPTGRADSQTNFGDFFVTPRILLSESKQQSQSLDLTFRTPTGNSFNGQNVASFNPTYNFWTNYWKGLVVRGGLGFIIPYSGDITSAGARSNFVARLAIGYYFTPHNYAPFGDLVFYVSNNLLQAIDNRGPSSTTTYTIGPGFRSHLGDNWYLLGAVDFPVTKPQPYDYQVFGGIMKVY